MSWFSKVKGWLKNAVLWYTVQHVARWKWFSFDLLVQHVAWIELLCPVYFCATPMQQHVAQCMACFTPTPDHFLVCKVAAMLSASMIDALMRDYNYSLYFMISMIQRSADGCRCFLSCVSLTLGSTLWGWPVSKLNQNAGVSIHD